MKKIFLIIFLILFLFTSGNLFSQVKQSWVQRFTSDSTRDETVNDMFVDAAGNVYITGSQRSLPFPFSAEIEAVTVKYNTLGEQQWIQNYHAPANNGAFCRAVYADAAGNVYVTGENAIYSGGANEALIIKYSPGGTQLWANRFQYVANFYCGGFDIITDADGNVYVTGEYGNGGNNIFLVKYSPSGNLINQTLYNSSSEGGRKIALDGSGKIIVGGFLSDNDSLSFIALKYEQNLDFVWSARWGQGVGNQNIIDMAIDINSNVILTGTNSVSVDYQTVKINPAGTVLWGKLYSSAEGWDYSSAVVTDNSGNVYVTGQTGTSGFPLTNRFCTIKYNPSGIQQWVRTYTDGDGYSASDIAVDKYSNLYVTGYSYSLFDIVTVKYNTAGELQWNASYNGPIVNGIDKGVAVGLDTAGNVYVSGNSLGLGTGYDIVTIKYTQTSIGIHNISGEVPNSFSLSQNYPNPFNPATSINFSVTKSANVKLSVYDIQGKEVETLLNGRLNAGIYKADWNAADYSSGVYFYKLIVYSYGKSDNFEETKRMILMK